MTRPRPWYEDFFAPDFWQVAQYEYTPERTGREVDYLASVLDAYAPGKRVLDLGCGTGRHAIGLAARGYQVVGLDVSAWALDRAAEAAEAAGVEAQWLRCDLLGGIPAEADGADAAICLQAFGLGADEQQIRLLREVRRSLVPGGLLVLDHSSVLPIVRHYAPEDVFETEGLRARFHRSYRTYAGPATSCVPLIARHPNLVVVRSMSKGYCCGGLRVGFALAGPRVTARLREVALPLGAGSTSLAVALGLLGQGDVFAALRERIAAVKPEVVAGLTGLGLRITPGADCLPWVTIAADQAARAALDRVTVRAKESPGASGRPVLKLAVPLSLERLAAFRARISAVADR